MDQIKELLDILKETPEMALWGISIYFIFILIKLSSWILAIKLVASQFIKRFFDHKETLTALEVKKLNNKRGISIAENFKENAISNVNYNLFLELINELKSTNYIHESDIRKAINILKNSKK
ncbi:hypothetical protein M1M25_gp045 [Tenacibaculum phage Gundel_1]|uniref:Uncharacterized protein n=1 Tax=Tenacibaculum phage Gundel_1 TaxID=2745672 RepID=A0A8E5EA39_9CAUD|nr:hypothetical protein M1M25_gp045 [Tenacibaculum phage Gundel_1]QQV91478.1 hypothetical protein Gundel1_45 [Tenacibaculum phage Gundel_1]